MRRAHVSLRANQKRFAISDELTNFAAATQQNVRTRNAPRTKVIVTFLLCQRRDKLLISLLLMQFSRA